MVGVDGIEHGDPVSAEQMKNLFGEGRHPVTGPALGRAYRPDAVAGFDLTFSPVKSVSTLWVVAPPDVAVPIKQAHDAAVADALVFLESHRDLYPRRDRRCTTGRDPRAGRGRVHPRRLPRW
ncbi:relaxase domain-containing protein [Nocardioides endophyticus]|uniref:relaxase domain-containing protein n=1 Tax=Nocardioides endophyticus TaxID=1353775 RepID=UPI0031F12FCF